MRLAEKPQAANDASPRPASSGMVTNPGNNALSVSVRRENRIDAVRNASLPDDQRDALEKANALHLEPR